MKQKTHRGSAKRFKKKKNGSFKRKKAFLRHGMRKRSQDAKRVLRKKATISKPDKKSINLMLPN